jgi:hypothetical protein
VGVLGEKAVPRVHRVGAGDLGGADDRRDVEIALGRGGRPDADGFVREAHVERLRVDVRVDRDRANPHLPRRAQHAHRDLTPVRDEDLLEHRAAAQTLRILKSF